MEVMGIQGCKSRSDEWNKMYRKYMKLRNLYRKSGGVELFLIENLIIKNNLKNLL